ncbi:MAG: hypothetical protein KDC84_09720 [Crocinitomicaceae bacterium]|nr:hypothetical protein [Crocinitomicaceae bacterium]
MGNKKKPNQPRIKKESNSKKKKLTKAEIELSDKNFKIGTTLMVVCVATSIVPLFIIFLAPILYIFGIYYVTNSHKSLENKLVAILSPLVYFGGFYGFLMLMN